jgi:hypothetical protein
MHVRRALAKFDLTVRTLWGFGYQLSDADRRHGMELVLGGAGLPVPR